MAAVHPQLCHPSGAWNGGMEWWHAARRVGHVCWPGARGDVQHSTRTQTSMPAWQPSGEGVESAHKGTQCVASCAGSPTAAPCAAPCACLRREWGSMHCALPRTGHCSGIRPSSRKGQFACTHALTGCSPHGCERVPVWHACERSCPDLLQHAASVLSHGQCTKPEDGRPLSKQGGGATPCCLGKDAGERPRMSRHL